MTEKSWPWDGTVTGDAVYAPYDAETETASIYRALAGAEGTPDKGGLFSVLNNLAATVLGQNVTVQSGRALIDGTWYENNANIIFAFAVPASSTRLDRIVLRKDFASQTVRLVQLTGTPSTGGGAAPTLTQTPGTTWDTKCWLVSITTGGVVTIVSERVFLPLPITIGAKLLGGGAITFSGATVAILFTTATYDPNSLSQLSGANPSRVTIPYTGLYLLNGFLKNAAPVNGAGGSPTVWGIRKNGTTIIVNIGGGGLDWDNGTIFTNYIALAAGDYLEYVGSISGGVSYTITSELNIAKIG